MKVSLNWIKELNKNYGCSDSSELKDVDKLVEKIGEQLGAVEEVINLGERYKNIHVVKVVECAKHPNADKLSVCLIDDGGKVKGVARKNGLVEVVCGAPNVKAGLTVAWIPPGATVPATFDKDPFVLEARELRGVVSNGMLASAKELAIGDSHEGILILDEAKPGSLLADTLLLNDYVIDIENKMFTHRPDCFGLLGVAREIAGISGKSFKSPDWYKENARPEEGFGLELAVKNEVPELVPRFTAIAMKNVQVKPSSVWLQSFLARSGIRPINNIVDITNWFMLATGQPLHAYDYDKLKTGTLGVRLSKKGEEIELLNGKTVKLEAGAVVITDGTKPVGLGGVMGGANTEVDSNTKNIVLECATFDMNLTRKTAMAYGLFTDAVTRFTKGQSPLQNLAVLAKTVTDTERLTGAQVASALVDNKSSSVKEPKPVATSAEFINSRLGEKLKAEDIKKLLENVEFKVDVSGDQIGIDVPFWRTDIEIPEDIVEEVGRLYGYDKLPQVLPKRDLTPAKIEPELAFKSRLRDILSEAGANEVLTYSFVNQKLLKAAGQDPAEAYHIKNALSPDLQYYRLSLVPSLLEKVHPNIKAGYGEFALFEIGKAHGKSEVEDGLPKEFGRLALVVASKKSSKTEPFFWAKTYVEFLADRLNLKLRFEPLDADKFKDHRLFQQMIAAYEPGRAALVFAGEKLLGVAGEFKAGTKTTLKLPAVTAGAELFLSTLQTGVSKTYQPLNKYPATEQDITLRAAAGKSYAELTGFIEDFLSKAGKEHGYHYELAPLDIYQKKDDEKYKQTTWRITLSHPERTLTTEQVNKLLDDLAVKARDKLGAERI